MPFKLIPANKKQSVQCQKSFKSPTNRNYRGKSNLRQRPPADDFLQPMLIVMIPDGLNYNRKRSPVLTLINHGCRFSYQSFCNRSHFKLKLCIAILVGLVTLQYLWYGRSIPGSVMNSKRKEPSSNGTAAISYYYKMWWAWFNEVDLGPKEENVEVLEKHSMITTVKPVGFLDSNVVSGPSSSQQMLTSILFRNSHQRVSLNDSRDLIAVSDSVTPNISRTAIITTKNNSADIPLVNNAGLQNRTIRFKEQNSSLPLCPMIPPVLVGSIKVWFDYPSWPELNAIYSTVDSGGHGKPASCLSRNKVAIILPYRDRDKQLRAFLHNLHSLLTKQQLDYGIFVVEQIDNQTFNRAKLFNVGFVEAQKLYDWQCAVFHDVDLLPEDDRNFYTCPEQPRHMSVAIDKFKYQLPYTDIFGGICALTTEQFRTVNGFSNDYWGWGGEDDDMASRVKLHGYKISRYPNEIARYKMIRHAQEQDNPVNGCRFSLMYKVQRRWRQDGLSSLNYELKQVKLEALFTRFTVDLLETESRQRLAAENICK